MSVSFADCFKGRSVFITGHTGFKGSWLSIWLKRLGAQVSGYSLKPPTNPNVFEAAQVRNSLAEHHEADIRDSARLQKAMLKATPSLVVHLAAQALVRDSYDSPRDTFETNVIGTCSVLDAVRSLNRPCVVIVVTSDKCYENQEHVWGYREIDPMGGYDPYSASKGATELVVNCYRRSFFSEATLPKHGVKLASVRAGNVIGGGDWAKDRLIPDAVRALSSGEEVSVRSPQSIRPWQHVLEPLSGYLTLAARMINSDDKSLCSGWNFGPRSGDEANVAVLMNAFCKAWGNGVWRDVSDPRQAHEARILRLSIDKAMSSLNWYPRWSFTQTVERTAQWYKKYYANNSMAEVCLDDIKAYENSPSQGQANAG